MNEIPLVDWVGNVLGPGHAVYQPMPWPELVRFISGHYLTPAIYSALRESGDWKGYPPDFRDYLEGSYQLNLERNRALLEQCREIIQLLNLEGMAPVVIKGMAALFTDLYREEGVRVVGDIDLLLEEECVNEASRLLQSAGYQPVPHPREGLSVYDKLHHLAPLSHPDRRAHVELHRDWLANRKGKKVMSSARSRLREIAQENEHYQIIFHVPDHRDWAMHNMIHSLIQDGAYWHGSLDMRQLYEFSCLVECLAPEARTELEMTAEASGLGRPWKLYTRLAHVVFGTDSLHNRNREFFTALHFAMQRFLWKYPPLSRGLFRSVKYLAGNLPRNWRYRMT